MGSCIPNTIGVMCHREQRSVVGRSIVAMTDTRAKKPNSAFTLTLNASGDGSARFEFVKLGGREGSRLKRRQGLRGLFRVPGDTETMKSAAYDFLVLQTFADVLYKQSRTITVRNAIRYGVWTFVVSAVLALALAAYMGNKISAEDQTSANPIRILWIAVLIFTAVSTLKGASDGKAKSFVLRLEAQRPLCQMQIELNTRGAGTATVQPCAGQAQG